jgi:hypothetical protein
VTATTRSRAEANMKQPLRTPKPPTLITRRPAVAPSTGGAIGGTITSVTPPVSGDMTDAQMLQAMLAPSYAANDQAFAREQELERHNQAVYAGVTQALMKELGGIPAGVQSDYSNMISQTTGMANAAADRLAAANPNVSTQAMLGAIGAPASQEQQVTDQNRNTFQGGAALLAGTQGFLPGETLAKVGAAQSAYARQLPAVAAAGGIRALQQLAYESSQNQQKLLDDRSQIGAQAPKLLMDLQSNRASADAKQQALDLEAQALGLKVKTAGFNQAATRARIKQGATRLDQSAASLRLRAKQAATATNLRYAEVYGYNPATGQPTLAAVKAAKADKAKGTKPPSATARKNWETFADQAFHGVAPKNQVRHGDGPVRFDPGDRRAADPVLLGVEASDRDGRHVAAGAADPQRVLLEGRGRPAARVAARTCRARAGGDADGAPDGRAVAGAEAVAAAARLVERLDAAQTRRVRVRLLRNRNQQRPRSPARTCATRERRLRIPLLHRHLRRPG